MLFRLQRLSRTVVLLAIAFGLSYGSRWTIINLVGQRFTWFLHLEVFYGELFAWSVVVGGAVLIYVLMVVLAQQFNRWRYPFHAELRQARRLFEVDPAMALVRQRITLERAIRALVPAEVQAEGGKDNDLFNYTKMLFAKGYIPRDYEKLVHHIRMTGNRAAHIGEASLHDARQCDRALKGFLIWFRKEGRQLRIPADDVRAYWDSEAIQGVRPSG